MTRLANILFAAIIAVVVSVTVVSLAKIRQPERLQSKRAESPPLREPLQSVSTQAATTEQATSKQTTSNPTTFPIIVRQPLETPTINLAGVDPQGRSGQVACSTCHSVRPANMATKTTRELNEFHQGLQFNHGQLSCYACHQPNGSDSLRLADGSAVGYQDVMRLCSQCHSPQATSFAHGAHGGMNGFWDRTRGPQTKNNCVDCHDPHVPAYPKMVVGFKPRDRFLDVKEESHDQ
ncbi:hypothetical protein NHH03_09180 [Stieleria sp. TO1_6]|uniref:cytochrome c3 family protein n=1 Tax=Stieleria tagensis TaxID=2956795 RepID=UPI00209BA852|nr:cytochrome c3 family protein [Stieleria tagensis]MCO8121907.1 hypothetical protein [Stieleria tagensis]